MTSRPCGGHGSGGYPPPTRSRSRRRDGYWPRLGGCNAAARRPSPARMPEIVRLASVQREPGSPASSTIVGARMLASTGSAVDVVQRVERRFASAASLRGVVAWRSRRRRCRCRRRAWRRAGSDHTEHAAAAATSSTLPSGCSAARQQRPQCEHRGGWSPKPNAPGSIATVPRRVGRCHAARSPAARRSTSAWRARATDRRRSRRHDGARDRWQQLGDRPGDRCIVVADMGPQLDGRFGRGRCGQPRLRQLPETEQLVGDGIGDADGDDEGTHDRSANNDPAQVARFSGCAARSAPPWRSSPVGVPA